LAGNQSIDLHVHSVYSDGSLTPDRLAWLAVQRNVSALAITDHDSLAGADDKLAACLSHGVECVAGVELSCELDGREAHILSLFADPASGCAGQLADISRFREKRMRLMLERLESLGIHIELPDLRIGESGAYGRPHLARAMVEKGVVKNLNEAFGRYLHDGGPVYVEKRRLPMAEGISLAKKLGGAAILAHAGISGLLDDLDRFVEAGLDGIEVYHPKHGGETIASLLAYCRSRKLLVSGGSDFHSPGDGAEIGSTRTPRELLEPLRELAAARKG
jgi:predicted metal-dependent phosphoesterase TrpH